MAWGILCTVRVVWPAELNLEEDAMTDRKIVDEQPEGAEPGSLHKKGAWLRGTTRGLHLQQIDEPVDEDVYDGIGADMRAERQRRNLSIADVAATLRIQQTYLEALEEGRTDDLPGPTYAIGFLRTYSEFLGLDGEEIIRQFKLEATLTPVERRLVFPEPLEEARRPGLSLALISLLVAGAVYGAWIFLEQRDLVPIEAVAEPPQRLTPYKAATETVKPVEASPQKVTAAPTTTATAPTTAAAMTPPSPEASAPQAEQEQSEPGDNQAGSAGNAGATASMAAIQPQNDPVQSTVQSTIQSTSQSPAHSSVQPADRAPEHSSDQAAVEVQAEPGEGERAAAADVSGLANSVDAGGTAAETDSAVSIGEIPATAGSATQAADASTDTSTDTPTDTPTVAAAEVSSEGSTEKPSETVTETVSNTSDSAPKPVAGEQGTPAATTAEASMAQPDVQDTTPSISSSPSPSPTPVREGSDVDTAPAMPSIQAAIAPPPPPAAPAAPARPLSEGSGDDASGGGTGVASLTASSDSLSYRPQTYGASNRDVREVLRARAESWVQIQGANNELLLTRMLRPGDSYHAPNRTDLVLMTGNAGAIEIMVDGEALGTLGPMGQVRRNIKLNADHLRGQLQAAEDPRPEVR